MKDAQRESLLAKHQARQPTASGPNTLPTGGGGPDAGVMKRKKGREREEKRRRNRKRRERDKGQKEKEEAEARGEGIGFEAALEKVNEKGYHRHSKREAVARDLAKFDAATVDRVLAGLQSPQKSAPKKTRREATRQTDANQKRTSEAEPESEGAGWSPDDFDPHGEGGQQLLMTSIAAQRLANDFGTLLDARRLFGPSERYDYDGTPNGTGAAVTKREYQRVRTALKERND
jgi:hypothetical protein